MTALGIIIVGTFITGVIGEGITGGMRILGKWQKKAYKFKYENKYLKKEMKRMKKEMEA